MKPVDALICCYIKRYESSTQSQITKVFLEHYRGLLGSSEQVYPIDLSALFHTQHELSHLDAPFSQLEVLKAVNDLPMNKASGLDGLLNEFAKQQWEVMRPLVMQIYDKFFDHRTDLFPINEARIVLLPKMDEPLNVTDFRPISVINLIPKIVSKVLANRIRPYLDELVSDHQTAFVRGRLIAENFLTTRELLHHVHKANSPAVLLKLDFAKAYDMLNWDFLLQVLTVKGFPPKMVQWISQLLSTASSRLEINGQLSDSFRHKRGLRQGDPLSPYLFIIAADVLQQMTRNISLAAPYCLTPKVPYPIINLQYADDTVLIASAKGNTLRLLMMAIHCFVSVSGLKINFLKSLFVPIAVDPAHLRDIECLLQCKRTELPITYLGMPLTLKSPSRNDFSPLLQKLENRLQGWQARFLSRAGRLQLIKSVLSSIPSYFMSCFQFPGWLLARMDAIRRNFLRTQNGGNRAVHLMNWHVVCLPIKNGGMGVVNLKLQNMALLLRWLWRLYSNDRRLWGSYAIMTHAVCSTPDGPLFLSNSGSFFWRTILKLRALFHSCVRFRIASGRHISFWFDPWAGRPLEDSTAKNLPRRRIALFDAKQSMHSLLPAPLTLPHHQIIHSLAQITFCQGEDELMWSLSPSSKFSVKSIYKVLSQGGKTLTDCAFVWKTAVTPSMRCFMFLLLNDRILTHEVMQRRKMNFVPGCTMCNRRHGETTMHLFFQCSYANQLDDLGSTGRVQSG